MDIFYDLTEWQQIRHQLPSNASLGFVPTMGNLHAGHASLFMQSLKENDYTAVSIFVNPTQFNLPEDFHRYPKTLNADLTLLKELNVHYCFLPNESMMYKDHYRFQIQETELSQYMEGKHRPGHFTGVLTVLMKLLHLIKPHKAYFGEKDYQQFLLIRDMVDAFFMDTEIIACPTIRENSGLAYSSRNSRLNIAQKKKAEWFARRFHQAADCNSLKDELIKAGIKVDYVEEHFNRRFAAVYIDDVRLIDNYSLAQSD
ncbi:pantoate--beta-alanine ligase [Legionella israelensis]|uniref:Pantothenate synthetase n=1 Tax=Legionella israelensis TaxID=454 RepID=A0A0W0W0R7_9GAMM|nr:pantoate--beta-alanine ligase [Legionella israelensis]KTD26103.1 pantoate-beta-alanine ligase [Legionella israelensis]QBR84999.1 pantoate--beta-alanine ligase [Legionella israelensis]QBS10110.1 pantoate--beta-alanine ligase [Legionella israelensis]SCY08002.1 pantothenate synthetase [Legionella israelensis DSM 19235]STX59697.1 pantoate--beta-alanine ligase [Legionella israelensis]